MESKDHLKEAFRKVKEDIDSLRKELKQIREDLVKITEILEILSQKIQQTPSLTYPTIQHIQTTIPTHNPTHLTLFSKGNQRFSTGNEGVPTDRQTNQQTDRHIENSLNRPFLSISEAPIDNAAQLLDSLDSLKKEIRLKFKQLTAQEMLVFSTLYQLEEEQGQVDYKILSEKLKITESSIRDYIGKLLKKGIPVEKTRLNNKQIQLSISPNLKKIASLSTILQLRDI